jgi:hypothetical protein
LWVPLTRDHLSVISGITAQGQVVMHIQPTAFSGAGVVRYLRHLLHQMPGKVLIIWDGGPIHHDKLVTAFLVLQRRIGSQPARCRQEAANSRRKIDAAQESFGSPNYPPRHEPSL